ncbi:hypothetical protein EDD68_101282 [Melghiribacillus thermohalophilus]|uniref:Uncharacterized protein n=1 Tax=Melghiribacillus thermohalophilus TaxID=1324956 RepID=A0A4R3NE49_9BACI|nr:DUF5325 family protein [Melghiribacillus thermohalophilus]TCT26925.1 hypothetical protein EDD68_101282 [Melghiribacillus thermohalophilus]
MNQFDTKLFLLALLVVICFVLVGIAIGIGSIWFAILFFLAGLFFMAVGLKIKRKKQKQESIDQ